MQATLKCPHCDHTEVYDLSEVYLDGSFVLCCKCFGTISIPTEWVQIEDKNDRRTTSEQILPVLEEGESVIIINEEHPWNGQIALVCGTKHKFTRVEVLGRKIWIPNEWVKRYDIDPPIE